jgi:hypothetical protein
VDGPNRTKLGLVISAVRTLVASERLPETQVAAGPRRLGLWRMLLARESLPEATPLGAPPAHESLPSLLLAREQLPPPPPAAPRKPSFWRWITDRETLPEETEDVR